MADIRALLGDNRLVTLTGAGGAGKTRLAIEVAAQLTSVYPQGIWYADLAPITHPDVVPLSVARALGLPDQPGQSITETLLRFVRDRHMLLVLDNCEHLLEASATLVNDLLAACSKVTILATSREPLVVGGEVLWQVPSLSLADEAIERFTDRARRARPDFAVTEGNADTVTEICRRLDGMPLAIELAAARVRALSLNEIVDSLHDRFRLLTGGARTAVRRQQTLRASVDWSHALLTQPERVLFRRLAVFMGGFDLDAAQAVAGGTDVERFQVLDQLSLLVDKSLVVAEDTGGRARYRLLETVRQFALEKLGESDEADEVRARHRDHYTAMASQLDAPGRTDYEHLLAHVENEIDNLRAAFIWSRENDDITKAVALASSLLPFWLGRGRISEGMAWLDAAGAESQVSDPALWARAIADRAELSSWVDITGMWEQAEKALAIAREINEPTLLARVLTACAYITMHDTELARSYFTQAVHLARELDDSWRLSQILARQSTGAMFVGDAIAVQEFAEEGRDLAESIGDHFNARQCRLNIAWAQMARGKTATAVSQYADLIAEASDAHDAHVRRIRPDSWCVRARVPRRCGRRSGDGRGRGRSVHRIGVPFSGMHTPMWSWPSWLAGTSMRLWRPRRSPCGVTRMSRWRSTTGGLPPSPRWRAATSPVRDDGRTGPWKRPVACSGVWPWQRWHVSILPRATWIRQRRALTKASRSPRPCRDISVSPIFSSVWQRWRWPATPAVPNTLFGSSAPQMI
ncbi:MAG: hypothetical protein QOJ20_506 [Mycobacterium sp.]|jgi:predicted ATPase|nr:hypothetical protein [Mycobacterium sp.]MDT5279311.1 hypothetical protein [Mycobacterium sp.]